MSNQCMGIESNVFNQGQSSVFSPIMSFTSTTYSGNGLGLGVVTDTTKSEDVQMAFVLDAEDLEQRMRSCVCSDPSSLDPTKELMTETDVKDIMSDHHL